MDTIGRTPDSCVADWCRIALGTGTTFTCFHHHLIYMCEHRGVLLSLDHSIT